MKIAFMNLARADEGEISTEIIKLKIKKMIEEEDSHKPITDEEIIQNLRSEGIRITPRAIAKYRRQMQILDSDQRKIVV